MITTKISNIFNNLVGKLNVVYENEILIKSDIVENYLKKRYYNYEFFGDNENDFIIDYTNYNYLKSSDLKKSLAAYNSVYNPIENYNSEVIETFGNTHSTTKVNPTTSNTVELISTFESEDFKNGNKIINSNDEQSTELSTDSVINSTITKGNIGVTTSQQMIKSEIELRKNNIYYDYLDEVFRFILFFVEGV